MARAIKYDEKTAEEICRRLSEGETLRAICRDDHMPNWQRIYDWIGANEEFAGRIARARELGADAIAEQALEILDEPPERTNTEHGDKVDSGHVAWQKNRAEMRLKLLAKWQPKKYGEKASMELTGAGGGPVQIDETKRAARVAALVALAQQRKAAKESDDVSGPV